MSTLPIAAMLGPFDPLVIPIWGPIVLNLFGLLVALGFFFGMRRSLAFARRRGLEPDIVRGSLPWLIGGALVGGHLGHALMYEPAHYLERPWELFYLWDGLSSFGGFIACTGLMVWYFRSRGRSFLRYGDALAFGLPFGLFFGRMGCFAVHDHPGVESDFFLAVKGIHLDPVWLCYREGVTPVGPSGLTPECLEIVNQVGAHDLGLYEALYLLALWPIWTLLARKERPAGFFIALLAICYAPARFLFDFLRSPRGIDVRYRLPFLEEGAFGLDDRLLGWTPGQYCSLLLLIVGVGLMRFVLRGGGRGSMAGLVLLGGFATSPVAEANTSALLRYDLSGELTRIVTVQSEYEVGGLTFSEERWQELLITPGESWDRGTRVAISYTGQRYSMGSDLVQRSFDTSQPSSFTGEPAELALAASVGTEFHALLSPAGEPVSLTTVALQEAIQAALPSGLPNEVEREFVSRYSSEELSRTFAALFPVLLESSRVAVGDRWTSPYEGELEGLGEFGASFLYTLESIDPETGVASSLSRRAESPCRWPPGTPSLSSLAQEAWSSTPSGGSCFSFASPPRRSASTAGSP